MDSWLHDLLKTRLHRPFLSAAGHIAQRISHRRAGSGQEIDERALTESLVDMLDAGTPGNVWGPLLEELKELGLSLNTKVRKSTRESKTGADLGITLERAIFERHTSSQTTYSALFQAKRIDMSGRIEDFFHTVGPAAAKQSQLMLDITPASFYLIYADTHYLKFYSAFEPSVFLNIAKGCSSPVWNAGCFEFSGKIADFLPNDELGCASGLLVVPATAVQAVSSGGKGICIRDLLPNCLPFWYWFVELFLPGFVGDPREKVRTIAQNVYSPSAREAADTPEGPFHVQFSYTLRVGNG